MRAGDVCLGKALGRRYPGRYVDQGSVPRPHRAACGRIYLLVAQAIDLNARKVVGRHRWVGPVFLLFYPCRAVPCRDVPYAICHMPYAMPAVRRGRCAQDRHTSGRSSARLGPRPPAPAQAHAYFCDFCDVCDFCDFCDVCDFCDFCDLCDFYYLYEFYGFTLFI